MFLLAYLSTQNEIKYFPESSRRLENSWLSQTYHQKLFTLGLLFRNPEKQEEPIASQKLSDTEPHYWKAKLKLHLLQEAPHPLHRTHCAFPKTFTSPCFTLRLSPASFCLSLVSPCSPFSLPGTLSVLSTCQWALKDYSTVTLCFHNTGDIKGMPRALQYTIDCPENGILGSPAAALTYLQTTSSAIHGKPYCPSQEPSHKHKGRPSSPPHYKPRDFSLFH